MYRTGAELEEQCRQSGRRIYEVAVEYQAQLEECTQGEVWAKLHSLLEIMRASCQKTLQKGIPSISGLTCGDASRLYRYLGERKGLLGDLLLAVSYALSCFEVNTSMGKIVAAPTAGSCGILPAAVLYAGERAGADEAKLLQALATASAIGLIIQKNATVSGAEGGCQAECGAAAAMAAAGVVELYNGSVSQSFHAGAMALKNVMGLVCDPIAGLVEAPCQNRNSVGAANAMICAQQALAGITQVIPFDQMAEAMYHVGRSLPFELRESALGGCAGTPAACARTCEIFSADS